MRLFIFPGRLTLCSVDVLVLENDPSARELVASALPSHWPCACVSGTAEAEAFLDAHAVKVLVCSDDLPDESGLMFLARTRDRWPKVRRVLLAPSLDGELFFHAMREVSLFDYLSKPVVPAELIAVVARARAQYEANERLAHHTPEEDVPADLPVITHPAWPKDGALFVLGFAAGAAALAAAFVILYIIKTQAGIDLLPLTHLRDLFQ